MQIIKIYSCISYNMSYNKSDIISRHLPVGA